METIKPISFTTYEEYKEQKKEFISTEGKVNDYSIHSLFMQDMNVLIENLIEENNKLKDKIINLK